MSFVRIDNIDAATIEAAKEEQKKLFLQNEKTYSVDEFQAKVVSGEITDDTGIATILINGAPSTFNVHIDRHCVTRSDGTLVTFSGFLKMYDKESLSVLYKAKPKRIMSVRQYQAFYGQA